MFDDLSIYEKKKLLIKDYKKKIDEQQKVETEKFIKKIQNIAKTIEIADNNEFEFEEIKIKFSEPVPHHSHLGYVVQVSIVAGEEKFLFAVDGNCTYQRKEINFILKENPSFILCDGPLRPPPKKLEGLKRIIYETDVSTLIIDHHTVRDGRFRDYLGELYLLAEQWNVNITTAAEYLGLPVETLEANRKLLSS